MSSAYIVEVSLVNPSSDDVFQKASPRYRAVKPSSGSNVIPRRALPSLAGLRPHSSGWRYATISASKYASFAYALPQKALRGGIPG